MVSIPFFAALFLLFLLRVLLGLRFLFAGWRLIQQGPLASKPYLTHVQGPFAGFFHSLADNRSIDYLNKWAMFLVGLCFIFGVFVRGAAVIGALLMILYWLSKFPHKEGVIDERIIYGVLFLFFYVLHAATPYSYNALLLQIPGFLAFYQSHLWLQLIL